MKKSVIAAAVAAVLAVPSIAMASVTVSGGLQGEVRSVGGDGAPINGTGLYTTDGGEYGKASSGNYGFLKFSASEDLGNGLKALAMYNSSINIFSNSGAALTGRDAYVALAGSWGVVLAGTASSAYKSSTVSWDPFLATSLQARGNGGMSALQSGYAPNVLAYAGSFNGVKVVVATSVDDAAKAGSNSTSGHNAMTFSVNAPIGPVEVALGYIDVSQDATLGLAGVKNLDATKLGVKWSAGPWTVAGQVEMMDKGFSQSGNDSANIMYLTGTYNMGSNSVSAAYGTADKKLGAAALGFNPTKNVTYMAVGLFHHFSKTTESWVGYRSTDPGSSAKENTVSVGLRVGF